MKWFLLERSLCLALFLFFAFFAAALVKTFFTDPAMLTQITNNKLRNIGKVIDFFLFLNRINPASKIFLGNDWE